MAGSTGRLGPTLLLVVLAAAAVSAAVPPSKRFRYVNQGEVSDYSSEYFSDYINTDIFTFPFRVCFFNSTPDSHYLAIRMGYHKMLGTKFRWVWEANRDRPVRANATLTFGADGNLVLADADGTVAWETGTANKGVVGLELLPNGNLVLQDKRGRFVWQSFDHPTDTLLVGQPLRLGMRLTARVSDRDGSDGPYSLLLGRDRFTVQVTPAGTSAKPLPYFEDVVDSSPDGTITSMSFQQAQNVDYPSGSDLSLLFLFEFGNETSDRSIALVMTKFNATQSFLRVDMDGNVRIYSFIDGFEIEGWEKPYALFRREELIDECQLPAIKAAICGVGECGLPGRCGALGVCENSQCVACPRPDGLLGWSSSCAPPTLPPCGSRKSTSYYKLVGVEHFSSGYTEGRGPTTEAACRDLCSKDCSCRAVFYRAESSSCLVVPLIGTITKVDNSSHVAYIKK